MTKLFFGLSIAAAAALVACCRPASIESADALMANPERLKEVWAQCKADHAKVGDAQCNAVAEATRRRFFGSGGPKYTSPVSPPLSFWRSETSKAPALPPSAPAESSSTKGAP